VGAFLIGVALRRIDAHAFLRSLCRVNVPLYLGFAVAFVLAVLTADTFATVSVYRRNVASVRFGAFWILRGASYLPALVNHHLSQVYITVALAREHGVSLARMAGSTLLVYASWTGCLLGIGCLAMLATHRAATVLGIVAAGIVYLIVIALRPAFLSRVKLLAPLFEAGVVGHLVALLVRVPHALVIFLGTWLPFFFFGVDIPVATALTFVPIIMIAVTLPITPQGFGTRDVLASTFFAAFAPGDTAADRLAVIVAATSSWGVIIMLVDAVLGLILLRYRMQAEPGPRVT
jgi:hypothetical protein